MGHQLVLRALLHTSPFIGEVWADATAERWLAVFDWAMNPYASADIRKMQLLDVHTVAAVKELIVRQVRNALLPATTPPRRPRSKPCPARSLGSWNYWGSPWLLGNDALNTYRRLAEAITRWEHLTTSTDIDAWARLRQRTGC
jgi:hypothetical protein